VIEKIKRKIKWVRSTDFLAVLTLFFSSILFFYDLFKERFLLTERDLGAYFIPPRFFWVESIRHGDLPLWNPYQFSGHPFFANPQNAILYPLNGLFFFLPFDVAFNEIIILHFFLGGLFTYLFVKDLKVNSTGALISGLIFMLSGYLLSVHSLLTILLSSVWTPLIMMFFRRAILSPGLKNEMLTSIFMTISFLGGGVEIVYGNFFVLLVMVIFSPFPYIGFVGDEPRRYKFLCSVPIYWGRIKGLFNRFRSLLIVSIVFLLLSAIQFIPFLELLIHSVRGKGISYQEATVWSFAPKDILLFFLPDAYGYFLDMKKYWVNQCWFKTLYTGGLPFILSLVFFLSGRHVGEPLFGLHQIGRPQRAAPAIRAGREWAAEFGKSRGFYVALILVSLFLALGQYNPLYPLVFKYVPFFNGIRYPVKFLYIFILILSVTAGLGFQKLTEYSREGGNKRLKNLLILFSVVSGLFLLFLILGHKEIESFLKGKGIDTPDFSFLSINLYHVKRLFFYLALFFLTLRVGYEVKWKGWIKVLLVLFLTADLFGNMGFYGKEKTQDYFRKTRILEIISSDQDHFRIFSTAKTISTDIPILAGNATYIDYLKEKHLPSMNLLYKLHDIWGIDVIHLKRIDDVYRAFTGTPSISSSNLVDLYSMKYIISVTLIEKDPRFELIYSRLEGLEGKREDLLKENTIKLYRNRNPLPRAWLVKDHRVLDEKSILAILSGKEFDPRREVLLEEEPGVNPPNLPRFRVVPTLLKGGEDRALVKGGKERELVKGKKEKGFAKGGAVGLTRQENKKGDRSESPLQNKKDVGEPHSGLPEFISERNNCLQLFVEAKEVSFLVLSDTYFPGWRAYLDGKPVKIFRANYNFRAVSIPPGKHEVKFVYHPMSVKLGVLVTSLGIIGILVMGLSSRFKRRVFPPVC
jgi:hypothetical protein